MRNIGYANLEWARDSSNLNMSDTDIRRMIDHIKEVGFSGIMFDVYVDASADGSSIDSFVTSGKFDRAIQMMNYANDLGLNLAIVNRFVVAGSSAPVDPFTVANSFDSKKFLKNVEAYYSELAPTLSKLGVDVLVAGSNMDQLITSEFHDQWASIFSTIKKTYNGVVTFAAGNEGNFYTKGSDKTQTNYWFNKVGIWDLMDVIGVNFSPVISSEPIRNKSDIVTQFFSNSSVGNNFANQLITLSETYDKKLFVLGLGAWNWDRSLLGIDVDGNLIEQGKLVYDPELQRDFLSAKLNFVHNNLFGIVDGYEVMGYEPWVYQTWSMSTVPGSVRLSDVLEWNARKVTQSIAGPTTAYEGTLVEQEVTKFLKGGQSYYNSFVTKAGAGDDKILTGDKNDVVYSNGGNDVISTNGGNDQIYVDSKKYLTIGAMNYFSSASPDTVTFFVKINGELAGKGTIDKYQPRVAQFPDGYWSAPITNNIDISTFNSINDIAISLSSDGGLVQIYSIEVAGKKVGVNIGKNTLDKPGAIIRPDLVINGGSTIYDLKSQNLAIVNSAITKVKLDGGAGIDTWVADKKSSAYQIKIANSEFTAISNFEQVTSKNVERIKFIDKSMATDLNGNAGTTAKILGSVFGRESVSNKNYVGIGLHFLDAGWTYDNLAGLALDAAGAKTNDQIVSLLWTNVIGTKPTATDKQPFIALLENGMSAGALAHLAADSSFNTTNINLVGLAQTGIEYIPVS